MTKTAKRKPVRMAALTPAFNNIVVALHRLHTIEEIFLFSFSAGGESWAVFIDGSGLDPADTNRRRFKRTPEGARHDRTDKGWRLVSQHFPTKDEAVAAMNELLDRLQELGAIELAGKADPSIVVQCQ